MKGARDQLLAGAGGPGDEDGAIEPRRGADLVAQRPHDLALAHQAHAVSLRGAHVAELETEEDTVFDGEAGPGVKECRARDGLDELSRPPREAQAPEPSLGRAERLDR